MNLFKRRERSEKPLTDYQKVFMNSRVNDAPYSGESLPIIHWDWPKGTFLDRRLRKEDADAPTDR